MITITLDESCINTVICEHPFVKILTIPKFNRDRWECLAQVNSVLAVIEVKLTPQKS